jgi:hypothetical protein
LILQVSCLHVISGCLKLSVALFLCQVRHPEGLWGSESIAPRSHNLGESRRLYIARYDGLTNNPTCLISPHVTYNFPEIRNWLVKASFGSTLKREHYYKSNDGLSESDFQQLFQCVENALTCRGLRVTKITGSSSGDWTY